MRSADSACDPGWATWSADFYIAVQSSSELGQSNVQQQRIVGIAVSSQYVILVKHTKQVYCAYIELGLAANEIVHRLR